MCFFFSQVVFLYASETGIYNVLSLLSEFKVYIM